jgi:hypothetical protein
VAAEASPSVARLSGGKGAWLGPGRSRANPIWVHVRRLPMSIGHLGWPPPVMVRPCYVAVLLATDVAKRLLVWGWMRPLLQGAWSRDSEEDGIAVVSEFLFRPAV